MEGRTGSPVLNSGLVLLIPFVTQWQKGREAERQKGRKAKSAGKAGKELGKASSMELGLYSSYFCCFF